MKKHKGETMSVKKAVFEWHNAILQQLLRFYIQCLVRLYGLGIDHLF